MKKDRNEEDYNFFATIRTPQASMRHILCRLWLPRKMTDRIRMVFYPTQRQADRFRWVNPFSVTGRIVGIPGNTITIRATEVWVETVPTRSLGRRRTETIVEVDPIDLQIFTTARPENKKRRRLKAYINYVLTPSPRELAPFAMLSHTGTGAVRARVVHPFSFTLRGRRHLNFRNRYHYEDRDDETTTWHDLVAKEERRMTRAEFARVDRDALKDLDDLLLLTSFSARYRVVCVGIDAYSENGDHFVFYRKNISTPERTDQDRNDAVVDLSDSRRFIRRAYRRFIASGENGPHDLLRHALYLVLPNEGETIESEFTTLYAALETLVLWHRRRVSLEYIIEKDDDWHELRDAFGALIKQHALLKNDKEKRKLIRAKFGELRRVPFSTAFESFCRTYGVDVTDLWPVTGTAKEMPLSEIRNHIVHGSNLKWSQWRGLAAARDHLRWTVERMFIALLGWPVADSKVRHDWLSRNRTSMIELTFSRRAMRGLPDLAPSETNATIDE